MKALPHVELRLSHTDAAPGTIFHPAPKCLATIMALGEQVGSVNYQVSPLNDRVYVNHVEVWASRQRSGYGMAAMVAIVEQYGLPLVPVFPYGAAGAFWDAVAARMKSLGLVNPPALRTTAQMEAEQDRWRHLLPEPRDVRAIREYLEWLEQEGAASGNESAQ